MVFFGSVNQEVSYGFRNKSRENRGKNYGDTIPYRHSEKFKNINFSISFENKEKSDLCLETRKARKIFFFDFRKKIEIKKKSFFEEFHRLFLNQQKTIVILLIIFLR